MYNKIKAEPYCGKYIIEDPEKAEKLKIN